ncbi:MAG: formylglycine-generating enzyme family protein [Planctomycetaceae bacterium]|nr:formylglycine-generating enzyme family protein [Planctomycetaceae bacterium]
MDSSARLSTPPPRTASSPLHPPTPPIPATPLVAYYYVDEFNQKQGPVCIQQLQLQAELGFINETTPLETETGRIVVAGTIPDLKFNFAAYAVNAPATPRRSPRPTRSFFAELYDFLYRSRFTDSPIYKIVYFFTCIALIIVGISLTIELAKWLLPSYPIPSISELFWPPRSDNGTTPKFETPIPKEEPVQVSVTTTSLEPVAPVNVNDGRNAGERMPLMINGVEYAFRWCPPGTFMMGSPENEAKRSDDEKQHQVTLSRGFWMLETQVTQEMWESVMDDNPSHFGPRIPVEQGAKHPVEQVSWNDCKDYIQKLNDLGVVPKGFKFSLPTETQWEYACRAGTTTPFHFGSVLNGDAANCLGLRPYGTTAIGKFLGKTSEVRSYSPNAYGLYDMHGNVWEWCDDWYGDYPNGAVTDPIGTSPGSFRGQAGPYRVLRGGGWNNGAEICRSARRFRGVPSVGPGSNYCGVRLSLVRNE